MQIPHLKKGVIFSSPVLPLDVTTMASALESAGQLDQLVTRWCFTGPESAWVGRFGGSSRWLRRPLAPVSPSHLRRVPAADLRQYLGRWLDPAWVTSLDQSFAMVDRVAAGLVATDTSAIVGREDACLECFRRGEEFNIPRIYQLATAHYATVERLVRKELTLFPDAFRIHEVEADFAPLRQERKRAELSTATQILCPSSFVSQSLREAGVDDARVRVIPLGTDPSFIADNCSRREPIVLYVGSISGRKGVHRLLRVWQQLGASKTHRLRFIGDLRLPSSFFAQYRGLFENVPRLPRKALLREYAKAEVFVFNALADGFGLVVAEAMAYGTPVLASRNSGAPHLIQHGENGWLYEYGDDEALGTLLDQALSSPGKLARMGAAGRQSALEWTSADFAACFLEWVNSIIQPELQIR